ncbi:uncharacterized protein K489DRAFT_343755 [Dissoconium aciculare CBS 342.82]|uniref:Uncharacterized protein n=1 Tax=Dissoconium aciculare CBS 342.82 TaxID=1314786 RepID=A0A6J3LVG1_9PEZI|nr:uncharacterized protein K489DRAFT_343755 [Dissoconium aciculare CBS 342.82]KAF1819750.1 hypothetical protein K489DRAFT_343755 [Dissoconium aciculare CBS 342.82]
MPYEDPACPYKTTDYYYRPGHNARNKSCTSLLYTCRRAWIEANHLPLQLAEPTFWMRNEERQPEWTRRNRSDEKDDGLRDEKRFLKLMNRLTVNNRVNLKGIHIFAQVFWLEQDMWANMVFDGAEMDHTSFAWPSEVKMTIRHTDWWCWERNRPLSIQDDCIRRLLDRPALKSAEHFILDLETLRSSREKVDQLENIIRRIKTKQKMIGDWVIDDDSGLEISQWTRPGNIDGKPVPAHTHLTQLDYCIYRVRWENMGPARKTA